MTRRGLTPVGAALVAIVFAAILSAACGDDDPPPDLTWAQLRNMAYPSQLNEDQEITLTNGRAAPGANGMPTARLVDVGAFGELDGDDGLDAVVFLAEDAGDGAFLTSLAAVVNDDGEPRVEDVTQLGTDVAVRTVAIDDDGVVTVTDMPRAAVDAEAGQALQAKRTFELKRGDLESTGEEEQTVEVRTPGEFEYRPTVLDAAPGAPAVVNATLPARGIEPYWIGGSEGQHLRVSLSSPHDNAVLSVQGLYDLATPVLFADYQTVFEGDLAASQVYAIRVISVSGSELDVEMTYELSEPPPEPAEPPPEVTEPEPPPASSGVPLLFEGQPQTSDQPLGNVSATAAAFVPGRAPLRGIAVVVPRPGVTYAENGDQEMETASVIKVVVMTCVMNRAELEGRLVNDWELSLMWPMITESNNDATDALWSDLGGGPGVAACLDRIGAGGITPYNGPYWGTSTASARGIATLMARIAYGDVVNATHREAALVMLESVISSQRWGVPAGADESGTEIVGVKDGWYPDDDGWRVNSVGFISPTSADELPYAIAVMTNEQVSQEYGIETIEGLAEPVWVDIRAR